MTERTITLYHMTHFNNLPSILREGYLLCAKQAQTKQVHSIALPYWKQRRATVKVPIPPYGGLEDYVPFYFAPRAPMLWAIYCKKVGNDISQKDVVYLVTSVATVVEAGIQAIFTDRHAVSNICKFYSDLSLINSVIDWQIMQSPNWSNTPSCPDRSWRRQAEFLVYQKLPITLIQQIGVYDESVKLRVQQIVAGSIPVEIRRDWYY